MRHKKKVRFVRGAGRKTCQSACLTRHCLAAYSGPWPLQQAFSQWQCLSSTLVVDHCAFCVHRIFRVPKCKRTSAGEQELALLLLVVGLIEVRELWFSGRRELGLLVGLIVELESVVGVSKVLLGLLFSAVVVGNPVKQLGSFYSSRGMSCLTFSCKAALGSSPDR